MKKLTFDAPSGFTVTVANQKVLDYDRGRQFCEITNASPSVKVFISFGTHPAEVNKGTFLMPNGGTVTLTELYMRSTQQVNAIADGGSANIAIQIGR